MSPTKEQQWVTLHGKFLSRATEVLRKYAEDLVLLLDYITNPDDARDLFLLMVLPEIEARGMKGAVQLFLEQNRAELHAHRKLYHEFKEEVEGFLLSAHKIFA